MRYLYLLVIFACSIACSEEKIHKFIGNRYIQFSENYKKDYSFVYAGSTVERDTIYFKVSSIGPVCNYDRYFEVKQVKMYGMEYEYENGELVDSAFVEKGLQAIPNVHYVPLDDPGLTDNYKIPADSIWGVFPLVVLRDASLKHADRSLAIELVINDEFEPSNQYRAEITLSDNISRPSNWSMVRGVLGEYGPVKHQLLIDATGKTWDTEFIATLTTELQTFYKFIAVRELEKINEERAAQGLSELREDDSDPNSAIKFY